MTNKELQNLLKTYPEEIKVGDKIIIEALVIRKLHSEEQLITCELPTGLQFHIWQRDFEALSPANGTKNAETAPKYDPCRKFRKGDEVRLVERMGRTQGNIPLDEMFLTETLIVSEDEDFCNNLVKIKSKDGREKLSHWWYLELVTPVEERKPYVVSDDDTEYSVFDQLRKVVVCRFDICHPHAKEAAEAERDRLNAEYRKEQK